MKELYVVNCCRTAIGSFGGSLKNTPPAVEGVCDKCGGHLEARSDDRPETVRARLKVYHELTDPVVDFYRNRGVLSEIDGTASIENATAEILKILEG